MFYTRQNPVSEDEIGLLASEFLWIKIHSSPNSINMVIVYFAAGSKPTCKKWNATLWEGLAGIYEKIKACKGLILIGDFNGELELGNKNVVPLIGEKVGRQKADTKHMLDFMVSQQLCVLNRSSKCEGVWTRMQKVSKSVIDYVISNDSFLNNLQMMKIQGR